MSVPSGEDLKNVNVIGFPVSNTLTPAQAIASAGQMDLEQVLVLGYDRGGFFTLRSSRMNHAEALWLLEQARHNVLFPEG